MSGNGAVLDFLLSRRSVTVGKITGPGPGDATLETILRAGLRVPDHGKLGPWRFVVIRGDARQRLGVVVSDIFRAEHPQATEDDVAYERGRFVRAPVVVAVASRVTTGHAIPEWEQVLSAGAACQNLLIAVHASGFVANWITEWCGYHDRVKTTIGLEPSDRIAGFIHIGTAAEAPKERVRPDYTDVVTEWRPGA